MPPFLGFWGKNLVNTDEGVDLSTSPIPFLFVSETETRFAKFFLMKLPAVEISQWFLLKKLHAMGETCTLFTMGFANPQVQDLRSALVREARPEMALPLYHLKFWK